MCAASDRFCDSESKLRCFSKNGMYVQIYLNYISVAYRNVSFLSVVSEPKLFCTYVDITLFGYILYVNCLKVINIQFIPQ